MALHKLNVLHWHLTDDPSWLIEIKNYQQLKPVGAWRVPAGQAPAAVAILGCLGGSGSVTSMSNVAPSSEKDFSA